MKTADLADALLDRLVAKADGLITGETLGAYLTRTGQLRMGGENLDLDLPAGYSPSTNRAQGGAIIERERISLEAQDRGHQYVWVATIRRPIANSRAEGPTPLVAAMRVYITSKVGDEIHDA